jgi:hypothetical protein
MQIENFAVCIFPKWALESATFNFASKSEAITESALLQVHPIQKKVVVKRKYSGEVV